MRAGGHGTAGDKVPTLKFALFYHALGGYTDDVPGRPIPKKIWHFFLLLSQPAAVHWVLSVVLAINSCPVSNA
jgi:hypothetical protein